LRLGLAQRLCLLTSIDYQMMEPQLKGGKVEGGGSSTATKPYKQPMAWLNLGLGLGIRL
jgi:hypothetical protein